MNETLIDPEAWETMKSMTEPAFLVELIEVFLSDSPQLIEQMRAGLASGEIEIVRRAAHSLKSNSASFGANRLAEAARDLEMLAKSGVLDGAGSKLEAIQGEYRLILPLLEQLKHEC
ncbi:MAG: Hpt domain-containing protein [Anaerolineales bacterium]|nr:Hpt domain-containing protein [Anaerolineales bacterium]